MLGVPPFCVTNAGPGYPGQLAPVGEVSVVQTTLGAAQGLPVGAGAQEALG